jgi:hypothetical protein
MTGEVKGGRGGRSSDQGGDVGLRQDEERRRRRRLATWPDEWVGCEAWWKAAASARSSKRVPLVEQVGRPLTLRGRRPVIVEDGLVMRVLLGGQGGHGTRARDDPKLVG